MRNTAIKEIKSRRNRAVQEYERQINDIRKNEKINSLYLAINALKWEFVKAKQEERRAEIDALIKQNENALVELFTENGYSINPFSLPYSCDKCNDTGIVDGKTCECAEKMRILLTIKENPLLCVVEDSFDKVDFAFYKGTENEKKKTSVVVKNAINAGKKIFLFVGKTGTGKTYLASVALKEMLLDGYDVRAVSAIRLNKEFLEYHLAYFEDKDGIAENYLSPDVLLIDDLGTEQIFNNVTVPYLLDLLTERAENKITFITTNLSLEEIQNRYGQRTLSRLLDKKISVAIPFNGEDMRFFH